MLSLAVLVDVSARTDLHCHCTEHGLFHQLFKYIDKLSYRYNMISHQHTQAPVKPINPSQVPPMRSCWLYPTSMLMSPRNFAKYVYIIVCHDSSAASFLSTTSPLPFPSLDLQARCLALDAANDLLRSVLGNDLVVVQHLKLLSSVAAHEVHDGLGTTGVLV